MLHKRRSWQEELEIIDRTMRAVSQVHDPEEMVEVYWDGVGELLPSHHYVSLSRRGVEPPAYLVTRSSRFTEHESVNPWTQRDRLPRLSGGLLGEIAYSERPLVIEDVPARLATDDPGRRFLEGFESLVALPQYDGGRALNVTISLFPAGAEFDLSILPMMHWQAGLFGRATQGLVLRNELQKALNALDRELQVVGEIQRSLLPKQLPDLPGFEVAVHYQTSARAGGDYYDFFPLADGACGIFIADVSGHGTPAAVLMAITHAIAHTRPGQPTPPGALLAHLNHHLARSYTNAGAFVTAFYAILNPATHRLTYAAAGHNPPRLLRGDRIHALDEPGGPPLGIFPDQTYEEATRAMEPDDLLLLYTDGITEAAAPRGPSAGLDLFGTTRLDAVLRELPMSRPRAEACINRIRLVLEDFTGDAPPADDRTLIALQCFR